MPPPNVNPGGAAPPLPTNPIYAVAHSGPDEAPGFAPGPPPAQTQTKSNPAQAPQPFASTSSSSGDSSASDSPSGDRASTVKAIAMVVGVLFLVGLPIVVCVVIANCGPAKSSRSRRARRNAY